MKPCFSWLCSLGLDCFMSIRIKALIKTFPMVGVVIKSPVHEKSLVSNNIFDQAFPLGRRTWIIWGFFTQPPLCTELL